MYNTFTLKRNFTVLFKRYFAITATNSLPYRKYDQIQNTPRKLLELGQLFQKAEGVTVLNNKPIKMQTLSSVDMAYHIKNLFHFKLEKEAENWGNYNKYNEEE